MDIVQKGYIQKKERSEAVLMVLDRYLPFLMVGLLFTLIAFHKYPTGAIAHSWGGLTLSEFSLLRFFDLATWLIFPFFVETGGPLYFVVLTFLLIMTLLVKGTCLTRFLILWVAFSLFVFTVSNFREAASLYRYLYLPSIPFSLLISFLVFQGIGKIKSFLQRAYGA